MTIHTLNNIHEKRGYCKGAFQEEVKEDVKEEIQKDKDRFPPGLTTQKPSKPITHITDEIVN